MRRLRPNRSNMDDRLYDIVVDAKITDTKLPDRRLAEKRGYEIG